MVLLEPRIMMDANLGWSVDADELTLALQGVAMAIDHQTQAIDDFLDDLSSATDVAAANLSVVLGVDATSADPHAFVLDTVARLREAATELGDSTLDLLTTALGDDATRTTTLKGDIGTALRAATSSGTPTERDSLLTLMSTAELDNIISASTLVTGQVNTGIDAFFTAHSALFATTGVTLAEARTAITTAADDWFAAELGGTDLTITLNDIVDSVDSTTHVAFATDVANGGVAVTVDIDDRQLDLNALFAKAFPEAGLTVDLTLDAAPADITFHIAETMTSVAALTAIGLDIDNFDFGSLLQVGGAIATGGAHLNLGMLDLSVTSLTTAELGLFITGDVLDLGVSADLTGAAPIVAMNDTNILVGAEARIKEVGAAGFVAIADGTEYDLLAMQLTGSLDFATDLDDTNATDDAKAFTASLTLSSIVDFASAANVAQRLTNFISDTKIAFDIDLSASVSNVTLRDQMETAIEGLAVMGAGQVGTFLQDIGFALSSLLKSAVFDLTVPFTDIELQSVTGAIADVFSSMTRLYLVDPAQLGFPANSPMTFDLVPDITTQTGAVLSGAQLDAIQNMKTIYLVVPTGASNPDGSPVLVNLTVDLSGNAVMTNAASTDAAVLNALISAMNTALTGQGLSLSNVSGALRVTAGHPSPNAPYRSFSVIGGVKRDDAQDDAFDLVAMGFGETNYSHVVDFLAGGNDTSMAMGDETMLQFKYNTPRSLVLGPNFATEMVGVDTLRFVATVDGVRRFVDVDKPAAGWVTGTTPNYADITTAMQTALNKLDIPVTVIANGAGTGFDITLESGTTTPVNFGLDPAYLTRGLTIDTLIDFVNAQMATLPVFAGTKVVLTEDGALMFVFPNVEKSGTITAGSSLSGLSTEALGLGDLANLELSAQLNATLLARIGTSAGIDLIGFVSDLVGASTNSAAELNASQTSVTDAVLDNVFFVDTKFEAELDGQATQVQGSAMFGMVEVAIGADDPTANFINIDTQFDMTLVGSDANGYNERLSLANIIAAIVTSGDGSEAGGLRGIIGHFDVTGGIVTDGAGTATDALGDAATASTIRVVDSSTYVPTPGEQLVQFYASLGDVNLNVGGINGLNEGLIDGINLSVADIFDPIGSFEFALLSQNQAALDALNALGNMNEGDILDAMSAIANMLVIAGDTLKDKLPFLAMDIPLLNFSLVDSLNFARDFIDAMREVRDNPEASRGTLDKVEDLLEEVFGANTVSLVWEPTEKTLKFDLSFKFLEDYSEELPFQVDLAAMLGDQLESFLGATVADLITGFVDVSGDGTMVFDPDMTMHFVFGLDLSPTLSLPTTPAETTTELADLATVSQVLGANGGGADLQIKWRDATSGDQENVAIDFDGITTLAEATTKVNTAVSTAFGSTVSFTFDTATSQFVLADSNSTLLDIVNVTTLFGVPSADSADVAGVQTIDLAAGFNTYDAAYSFNLTVGQDATHPGETVVVSLNSDNTRDTAAEFTAALNAALEDLAVSRRALNDAAAPGLGIAVSQLVQVVNTGNQISLVSTNLASTIGVTGRGFSVGGTDAAHDVSFTLIELDGSNAARMLGFTEVDVEISGAATSEVVYEATLLGAPRVYLDTAASGIQFDLSAGVADGLNISIGLGPLTVDVVDGHALLTNADQTGSAYIRLGILDIDGDANTDQYNLADIYDLATDSGRSFGELFTFETSIGVSVDLPFSDSLGVFDPEVHGMSYNAPLLVSVAGQSVQEVVDNLTNDQLQDSFTGDLVNLYLDGVIDTSHLVIVLPGIDDLLNNFNYIAFLNDPRAVLDGLDMILDRMQQLFDNYLSDIDLPVVGDAIGAGVSFFNDFRYNVIEKIRVLAETPKADGTYPTTEDLLTDAINGLLNDIFDTQSVVYLQADLVTNGLTAKESYLVGSLNFNGVIFDEMLDIAFDFGIPGLDMAVDKGSAIHMTVDYTVNIGFGLDRRGFFLLNDTDDEEVQIRVTADAGTFSGSMNVLNVLGLEAEAVTLDSNGDIDASAGGTAVVSATLGADLYGDTEGLLIVNAPTTDETKIARNLGGLDLRDGLDNELHFERLIYLSSLNTSDMINFAFGADFDIVMGLKGNILDPSTGTPLLINDVQVIPTVMAEVVVKGSYSYGAGLELERLSFENVRIDATQLYQAVLKPVLDPIDEFLHPIAEYFKWTQASPFDLAFEAIGKAIPIIGIADTVIEIGLQVDNFLHQLVTTGGIINFGDFDFTGNSDAYANGNAKMSDGNGTGAKRNSSGATALSPVPGNQFGWFGNIQQGLAIEVPLLTDPMNALNLLLGNYSEVDLIKAHYNLMNIDTGRINVTAFILDQIGAPGWVDDIIESAFKAYFNLKFKAGFTAGYDLSGIVNFVNTLDPERLLDGVFLDSAPGSLITAEVGASISLNLGIAGLDADVGAGFHLAVNDPNRDGKLRIPELIALVEAAASDITNGDFGGALGTLFIGDAGFHAYLSVWAGINLPWPLPDIKWSTTVFDIGDTINFGGNQIPARMVTDDSASSTAYLNIGARTGDSMTRIVKDGNDQVSVSGSASGFTGRMAQGGLSYQGLGFDANAIVVPAGEGNNSVDLSGITDSTPTVTYTGSGTDTITLPAHGVHVVFAGEGSDTITAPAGADGTYIIFGEKGSETVNIPGGNVIFFGDSDFGMRDLFLATYPDGNVTAANIRAFFNLDANGLPAATGQTNYDLNGTMVNLPTLIGDVTTGTQMTCGSNAETVTLGAGNHVLMTGGGKDVITINGASGVGTISALLGAGDDILNINTGALSAFVEAGAGADRVYVAANASEIWGWGKDAGIDGQVGTDAANTIDTLAMKDGSDVLVGGLGNDQIYGQIGNDMIQGGLGNDTLAGGIGKDLITGGTFALTDSGNNVVAITAFNPSNPGQTGINLAVVDAADGADSITGSYGDDILMGGGGGDTIQGGSGADVILGDFGKVGLSSNLVAQTVKTEFDTSTNAGTDNVQGNEGNDILIVGGGIAGQVESVYDIQGSNVVIGDFGQAVGNRLMEAVTKLESFTSSQGSADSITTGAGNDMILGGEGNDVINSGAGGDLIIGDIGTIDISNSLLTAIHNANAGNDSITTAATDGVLDLILAGEGNDTVAGGLGGLVLLADNGEIELDAIALGLLRNYEAPAIGADQATLDADATLRQRIAEIAQHLTSNASASDGNDVVTVEAGALIAALGGGDDSATNNDVDSVVWVLGDDGTIAVTATDVILTSTASANDGNDSISAGNADNRVIAGEGDDTVTLGNGDNQVLGDTGSWNGLLTLASDTLDGAGADVITTGTGGDVIIGGGGNDSITSGDGADRVLGDSGSFNAATLVSLLRSDDGNDTVNTGAGDDWAVLGQGNDSATGGTGADWIIGDSGQIIDGTGTTSSNDSGGSDTIDSGADSDVVIGGAGSDSLTGGTENDFVLGDSGSFDETTLISGLQVGDGNDTVDTGAGDDWAVLGQGNDSATGGTGADWIIGDSGQIIDGTGTTSSNDSGGSDTIDSGADSDVVIGGAGGDSLTSGTENDFVLGDSGSFDETTLVSGLNAGDGNDTVDTGAGDDWAVLGQGNDSATGGTGADWIIGDSGQIIDGTGTTSSNDNGGSDTIDSGADSDVVIGGAAGDSLIGGTENDFVLGDSGSFDETTLVSGLNAGDGNDTVDTGTGDDWAVLGQGNDSATGGTGADWIIGDSGQIIDGTGTTSSNDNGGSDTIDSGADSDVVIGGANGDSLTSGTENDFVLGDSGSFDETTLISGLQAGDGNDTVDTGTGDDWAVLGQGNDSATGGTGADWIIGDSGQIIDGTGTTSSNDNGGSDTIDSGADSDVVIGGANGDSLIAGEGDNVILGDSGSYDSTVLTSALQAGDGNDTVTSGAGQDLAVLGQGNDTADVGNGNNRVIGDSGTITMDGTDQTQTLNEGFGGNDTITAGTGNDVLVGGANADTINGGAGDNTVQGDNGFVLVDPAQTPGVTEATTSQNAAGGNDVVTTLGGRDVIQGGEGADTILAGAGSDLVMGDLGQIFGSAPGETGSMTSDVGEVPGDDSIEGEDGSDLIIAGQGDDLVLTGNGDDVVAGDSATLTFRNDSDVETLAMTDVMRGGQDTLTGEGTDGDKIMLGQYEADSIIGSNGDDVLLGDLATITFLPFAMGLPGQSTADRVNNITTILPEAAFDDTMTGGDGYDIMVGGMGADSMHGDNGQDVLVGDNIIMTRAWTALIDGSIFERMTLDTNFAYLTGGTDTIHGDDGADIMIGGLGPDLFYGDTASDLIYSDGYAGIFNATWTNGFGGPTPKRMLLTSNFAGPGAIDVVSEAQQDSSIGGPLDLIYQQGRLGKSDHNGPELFSGDATADLLGLVSGYLGQDKVTQAIALLLLTGADKDLLIAALRAELAASLAGAGRHDLLQQEILIQALIAKYLAMAGVTDEAANQADKEDVAYLMAAE